MEAVAKFGSGRLFEEGLEFVPRREGGSEGGEEDVDGAG